MIDEHITRASNDCLEVYKAVTERDGSCETCIILFSDHQEITEPIGIGRLLPPGIGEDNIMGFCRHIAEKINAQAFLVTTNVWMMDESFAQKVWKDDAEDGGEDEMPDSPTEIMQRFPDQAIKGIIQFLAFRWGTTYSRFSRQMVVNGLKTFEDSETFEPNITIPAWGE